jgi:hypothetical protein
MQNFKSNCKIFDHLVENQPQKVIASHSMESMRLYCPNIKVFIFLVTFHSEVPHSKIREN